MAPKQILDFFAEDGINQVWAFTGCMQCHFYCNLVESTFRVHFPVCPPDNTVTLK